MLTILFLCTGASCRSQMGAGWANHLHAGRLVAYAAGVAPKGVNPLAVRAMAEAGVDLAGAESVSPDDLHARGVRFDLVVAVCDHAASHCPVFHPPEGQAAVRVVRRPFDDPPELARGLSDEDAMPHYRRVRDEIREFVASELLTLLNSRGAG